MTRITTATAALLASTALAYGGGVERQGQTTAILFEDNYVEFGYTFVDPEVSGTQLLTASGASLAGSNSGDVTPDYSYYSFSVATTIGENLTLALIYDEPIGADVNYMPNGGSGYLYGSGGGSQAEIRSQALTFAARYQFTENISAYAGVRLVTASGDVTLFNGSGPPSPDAGNRYALEANGDYDLGFMIGAAYEIPDIALRVALTYYSATTHGFTGTEGILTPTNVAAVGPTAFEVTIPQQVLLEAQTGIAEGTLIFGSVRWTEWTAFEIAPPAFVAATGGALVDYDNDTWTYTLGGARRLSDEFALLASITHEAQQGGFAGNLGPTDGRTSIGIGGRYDFGDWRITGGINYSWLGDATTEAPGPFPPGLGFGDFADNTSIGVGLRIGYSF